MTVVWTFFTSFFRWYDDIVQSGDHDHRGLPDTLRPLLLIFFVVGARCLSAGRT